MNAGLKEFPGGLGLDAAIERTLLSRRGNSTPFAPQPPGQSAAFQGASDENMEIET